MRDMRQNMSLCMDMMNRMQSVPGVLGGNRRGGMMMSGCPGCAGIAQMSGMTGGGLAVAWIGAVLLVLLGLSLVAALVALAAYLWNRSRVVRQISA